MVTCYPVAGKQKSIDICEAFARGCGGRVQHGAKELTPGPAFFWGVDASNEHLWHQARDSKGVDYYYGDNSYLDSARGEFYRVTFNRLQHSGIGISDGRRFAALGINIQPWTTANGGGHVVVCPQSDYFMQAVVGYPHRTWTEYVVRRLQEKTDRPIRVREWNRDKAKLSRSLPDDLQGAHALLTWSSAAAITALLSGVPSFSWGVSAACALEGEFDRDFEEPLHPPRETWAGVLADNQWTIDEMTSGECWEGLRRQRWGHPSYGR